jgi:hypothetical protein
MHIEEVTRPAPEVHQQQRADPKQHIQADPVPDHHDTAEEDNVSQIHHQEAAPTESHGASAEKARLLTSPAEIRLNAEVKVNEDLTAPEVTVHNSVPEVKANNDLPDADVVVNDDLVGGEEQQLYEETGAGGEGGDYLDTSAYAYHDQASGLISNGGHVTVNPLINSCFET